MDSTWHAAFLLLLAVSLLAAAPVLAEAAPTSTPESTESDEVTTSITPSTFVLTGEPVTIHTFKNPQCALHRRGQTRRCGMKELNPIKGNGVVFWNPKACQNSKCQCRATKEIRREKRTIINNKTVIEYRRYRIFECI